MGYGLDVGGHVCDGLVRCCGAHAVQRSAVAQADVLSVMLPLSVSPDPCSAYADPGALNRAEWVKFVAVFFNKEVEANKLFSTITTDYQKLNTSARAAAAAATTPVRAAWISKFGDSISMSYAVYKQQLVTVSAALGGAGTGLGWGWAVRHPAASRFQGVNM